MDRAQGESVRCHAIRAVPPWWGKSAAQGGRDRRHTGVCQVPSLGGCTLHPGGLAAGDAGGARRGGRGGRAWGGGWSRHSRAVGQ